MNAHPSNASRLRILYVTYDGVAEPLGRSQVLGYLLLLAADHDITLVSFEKDAAGRAALRAELEAAGITWLALEYHRRPPVLSTLLDVAAGRRALVRASRGRAPDVVHVRSYVPALMATLASRRTGGRLLFDIRGFWADERVEGGLWRAGGVLYRIAKRCERDFFTRADGVVTLTEASVPQIRAWMKDPTVPVEVIPTCVDPERFATTTTSPDGPRAVWSGSIGTWYRFDLGVRLAIAGGLPLTVLTRQIELAHTTLAGHCADVRTLAPEEIPGALRSGDIGLSLIASSFSKIASAPTRFAEYLAAGMPVAVTPGVGDLEALVEAHDIGVVVRADDDDALRTAAARLRELAADPAVRERCRRLAAERFDVAWGARQYAALYRRISR